MTTPFNEHILNLAVWCSFLQVVLMVYALICRTCLFMQKEMQYASLGVRIFVFFNWTHVLCQSFQSFCMHERASWANWCDCTRCLTTIIIPGNVTTLEVITAVDIFFQFGSFIFATQLSLKLNGSLMFRRNWKVSLLFELQKRHKIISYFTHSYSFKTN